MIITFKNIYHQFLPALLLSAVVFLSSCDDPPGSAPHAISENVLSEFTITPDSVELDPNEVDDIGGETVIDFEMTVVNSEYKNYVTKYRVIDKLTDSTVEEGFFGNVETVPPKDNDQKINEPLIAQFQITVSNTDVSELNIVVYAVSNRGTISNTIQRSIRITGLLSDPPVIEFLEHPDTVYIPAEGNQPFSFDASVFHPNGQQNIEGVFLELFDSNNNQIGGAPFEMEPDEQDQNNKLYSIAFQIDSNNQPDDITVWCYAIDRAGVSSDTVFSSFTIAHP